MSSRIITLGEHKFELPPFPASQDEVLFAKESPHNQYWRRDNSIPDFFYGFIPRSPQYPGTQINCDYTVWDDNTGELTSLSREDTQTLLRILNRELYRRQNGVWMMNDNELTWLAPHHYFQLQWCPMKGYTNPDDGSNYGQYREFQAKVQYFLRMCLLDNHCGGDFITKGKKTGLTQLLASNYLNRSTLEKEKNLYMMSKSGDDVRDTNMDYYFYGFDGLPPIMRPTVQNRTLMKMIFGNPKVRPGASKANMLAQLEAGKGYNTKVIGTALAETAFDGPLLDEGWCDEFTKYDGPFPKIVFSKTKETTKLQRVIQPFKKMHYTGYTSEDDGRAFLESKGVWDDSLLSTRSAETGETKSGLYTYCIPADESEWGSFDRHGRADTAKTRANIMATRKQLESDPPALQAEIRQRPLNGEEAWREGGGGNSAYNNERLGLRKKQLVEALNAGNLPFHYGNLDWAAQKMGLVKWERVSAEAVGRGEPASWRWSHPEWSPEDFFNRAIKMNKTDRNGLLMPDSNTPHIGFIDPVEEAMKSMVAKGSKVAMTCMNEFNSNINGVFDQVVTGRFFLRYLNRCENPLDDYEQMKMAILWTSGVWGVEANRMWVTTKLVQDGLENFLLVRDVKTKAIVPFNRREHQALLATTVAGSLNTIADYVRATKVWMSPPKGDEVDPMLLLDDEEQIEQWMRFKVADTKEFDLAVCSSWNITAFASFPEIKQKLEERAKRQRYDQGTLGAALKAIL